MYFSCCSAAEWAEKEAKQCTIVIDGSHSFFWYRFDSHKFLDRIFLPPVSIEKRHKHWHYILAIVCWMVFYSVELLRDCSLMPTTAQQEAMKMSKLTATEYFQNKKKWHTVIFVLNFYHEISIMIQLRIMLSRYLVLITALHQYTSKIVREYNSKQMNN